MKSEKPWWDHWRSESDYPQANAQIRVAESSSYTASAIRRLEARNKELEDDGAYWDAIRNLRRAEAALAIAMESGELSKYIQGKVRAALASDVT
jgi:hypothetical protein